MRGVLSRHLPPFTRVLIVESASRAVSMRFLARLYESAARIDLVTCYPDPPPAFRADRGSLYRVSDYRSPAARRRFIQHLRKSGYSAVGIICSDEPIMMRWKWAIAARVPAKVFVINENGDRFWLDRHHLAIIRHFVSVRAGLSGAGMLRTAAGLLAFPFTLAYLLTFAATVHLRRKLRAL